MSEHPQPFIQRVPYNEHFEDALVARYNRIPLDQREEWSTYQLDWPTVYVVRSRREGKYGASEFEIYVGETNDIRKRTRQHLYQDPKNREDWARFTRADDVEMYVVGHPYFNKSLTLDIENRLLHYLEACKLVERRNNRRTNEQRAYFTVEHLDTVFDQIWGVLQREEPELFEPVKEIKERAIFKASPFQRLNEEQLRAQDLVYQALESALEEDSDEHRLILVSGEAGSGKTVLISSIFAGIMMGVGEEDERYTHLVAPENPVTDASHREQTADQVEAVPVGTGIDGYLISGHKNDGGQYEVYKEIIRKSGIPYSRHGVRNSRVYKPTNFINTFSPDDPVDLVLIDEAHLLLTQKSQSYTEEQPQIGAILDRAKVVVAVFDPKQTLEAPQYWDIPIEEYFADKLFGEPIRLENQMRLEADPETISWIRHFVDDGAILPVPSDSRGYDLRIYETPSELEEAIRSKDSAVENSLARLLATYDWEFKSKKSNDETPDGAWYVDIAHANGEFTMPWNLMTEQPKEMRGKKAYRTAWSEAPHTINEIGSTYTIQGFDLNYAGVILGPSIVYRDGRVQIDPTKSAHKKAVYKRTPTLLIQQSRETDPNHEELRFEKKSHAEEMIRNELNVLLTRGTKGLFIYAVDDQLREELLRAAGMPGS